MASGAVFKPCFCGPCFGAGDVPGNGALSIRHTTRNFPNREGSRPADGQLSGVALMDARSIAATAANGGVLTAATDIDYVPPAPHPAAFDGSAYEKRVYFGFGKARPETASCASAPTSLPGRRYPPCRRTCIWSSPPSYTTPSPPPTSSYPPAKPAPTAPSHEALSLQLHQLGHAALHDRPGAGVEL
jgi:aconitate hydratase